MTEEGMNEDKKDQETKFDFQDTVMSKIKSELKDLRRLLLQLENNVTIGFHRKEILPDDEETNPQARTR
jgi:uncharacterized protein (DUF342 family)